jgi:hypothetical protein
VKVVAAHKRIRQSLNAGDLGSASNAGCDSTLNPLPVSFSCGWAGFMVKADTNPFKRSFAVALNG